ncbi:MAG: ferrochelatase [Candidatus Nanopelagicales bacterium]
MSGWSRWRSTIGSRRRQPDQRAEPRPPRRAASRLARRQVDVPVLWGNRNAAPTFPQALAGARSDGARAVVAITTSAYSSYSGCRQYRENLAAALEDAGLAGILDVRDPAAGGRRSSPHRSCRASSTR